MDTLSGNLEEKIVAKYLTLFQEGIIMIVINKGPF